MQNSAPPWIVTKYPQLAKIAVWLGLFLLIFWLRSFFLLIFLTFVFSFLQYNAGEKLKGKIQNRRARTWLIGIILLLFISTTIYFLATEVKIQAKAFIHNFDGYILALDAQVNQLAESFPVFNQMLTDMKQSALLSGYAEKSSTLLILQHIFDLSPTDGTSGNIKRNLSMALLYSGKMVGVASSFLLSLLFSFLIILDYPRLTRSFAKLEKSRFAFVFQEVKPGVMHFSRMLGKAFEAQFFIAILNSLLTGIGLLALGIGKYSAFLVSAVFLCSFIPIAGMFISSVPICMIALQDNGPFQMLLAVGLIAIIHTIEAYILNPRIYGSRMSMNPVIVLGILTIFGKLFGFWGLVLGIPLCNWFIKVVCFQEELPHE
ncbi:MAG: AI-2E family transporter [Fibromonadaceae bacterium]|jgi:predicted PurR-regulated permease PerM|nr:AI-2E family transporter [Fibromonadaceae bacterium]